MRRAGNVVKQMCDGIDASAIVLVFITRRYVDKVAGDNAADNCQKEFNYAELKKTNAKMVAAVMEPRMKDPSKWDGAVGMALGGQLYYTLDSDDTFERDMEQLFRGVVGKLESMIPGIALAAATGSPRPAAPPEPFSAQAAAQHEQVRDCLRTQTPCTLRLPSDHKMGGLAEHDARAPQAPEAPAPVVISAPSAVDRAPGLQVCP